MWIVHAALKYEEVIKLVTEDPYYHPQARRFQIKFWGEAIDKMVTV